MTPKAERATEIQRQYYAETAGRYEQMHAHEGAGDDFSMRLLHAIVRMVDAQTVLDVGTGTGLNLRELKNALPHLSVCGIEPVCALIEQAARCGPTSPAPIFQASGEALPFRDASLDVVCEFAVLHHVPIPGAVVKEMLRVARKAKGLPNHRRRRSFLFLQRLRFLSAGCSLGRSINSNSRRRAESE